MSKNMTKSITKPMAIEEIREHMASLGTAFDAKHILQQTEKETNGFKTIKKYDQDTNLFRAMTLYEFNKGTLMLISLPEAHRAFALEFSRNLQIEFECTTESEKSLAELTAINYSRVLETENRITSYLRKGTIDDLGAKFLAIMSKELDRAQRHYFMSLQTLKSIKTPPLEVNIKTQTAVVGQNQVVQANNK